MQVLIFKEFGLKLPVNGGFGGTGGNVQHWTSHTMMMMMMMAVAQQGKQSHREASPYIETCVYDKLSIAYK